MQALQPGAKTALDATTLQSIAGDVPLAQLTRDQVVGQPLIQVMVASGLQPTKAASKRMIKVCRRQLSNASYTSVVRPCIQLSFAQTTSTHNHSVQRCNLKCIQYVGTPLMPSLCILPLAATSNR